LGSSLGAVASVQVVEVRRPLGRGECTPEFLRWLAAKDHVRLGEPKVEAKRPKRFGEPWAQSGQSPQRGHHTEVIQKRDKHGFAFGVIPQPGGHLGDRRDEAKRKEKRAPRTALLHSPL